MADIVPDAMEIPEPADNVPCFSLDAATDHRHDRVGVDCRANSVGFTRSDNFSTEACWSERAAVFYA